jgi:hypothetical protein
MYLRVFICADAIACVRIAQFYDRFRCSGTLRKCSTWYDTHDEKAPTFKIPQNIRSATKFLLRIPYIAYKNLHIYL